MVFYGLMPVSKHEGMPLIASLCWDRCSGPVLLDLILPCYVPLYIYMNTSTHTYGSEYIAQTYLET